MQKFLEIIKSKSFKTVTFFIAFTALITLAVCSQNFFFQKVIDKDIALKDVYAQKDITVVDTEKTELLKKEIARNLDPILTRTGDEEIMTNLTALQNNVNKIRQKKASDSLKTEELKVLFASTENTDLLNFMLRASDEDITSVFDKSKITLTLVLNRGVSYKDFEDNNVPEIIKKNIPQSTTRYKRNLVYEIINQVIVPNFVISEEATNIARKNVQDNIKPYEVEYKKGQLIIMKGEVANKLKKDALRAAGNNVLEVNFGGILGIYTLVALFTFVFLQYERNFERDYYNRKYLFIMATFTLLIAFIAAVLPTGFSPYILPIPAYTILLSIFTTPRNAFFASTIVLALLATGMHYNTDVVVAFMLLNTVVMTCASRLKYSKRSDLLIMSLKITLAGLIIVGGIYFLERFMMDINNAMIAWDMVYIVLNCLGIGGILLLGALPIIEYSFGVMTPYGLAELADHNQPLLKKLLSDAPGTFNHSLIVSHLSEAAAEAIGANPILARVGTMYHDIGKLLRPMFFVENQSFYGIENPHKTCTPRFSKMLITAHPKDGIELAKEYHLPQVIHNFILQHHGTSLVSYFYNEALKQEGEEAVKEEQFRYPGPKPNMKETAILMIADAVESAVRAAKNPTNEEIDAIIDKIIKERLSDGQLEDSPLTLKDLKTIAETFSRMLRGMHHKRIKYHNDLVQELDKSSKQLIIPTIEETIVANTLDADLESKIKELESKKNDNN